MAKIDLFSEDYRYPAFPCSGALILESSYEIVLGIGAEDFIRWASSKWSALTPEIVEYEKQEIWINGKYGEPFVYLSVLPIRDNQCVLKGECWQSDAWVFYSSIITDAVELFHRSPLRAARLAELKENCSGIKELDMAVEMAIDYFDGRVEAFAEYEERALAVAALNLEPVNFEDYIIARYRDEVFGESWVWPLPGGNAEVEPQLQSKECELRTRIEETVNRLYLDQYTMTVEDVARSLGYERKNIYKQLKRANLPPTFIKDTIGGVYNRNQQAIPKISAR